MSQKSSQKQTSGTKDDPKNINRQTELDQLPMMDPVGAYSRSSNSQVLSPGDVLTLQRTVGNQVVQRMLDRRERNGDKTGTSRMISPLQLQVESGEEELQNGGGGESCAAVQASVDQFAGKLTNLEKKDQSQYDKLDERDQKFNKNQKTLFDRTEILRDADKENYEKLDKRDQKFWKNQQVLIDRTEILREVKADKAGQSVPT